MNPLKKLKHRAQRVGGAYGHQHVNKWLKRAANRFIRRFLKEERREYED
jgi:hypothetical protein